MPSLNDDDVDWSVLQDSYGEATAIPDLLERLAEASTRPLAADAAWRLQERLTDQGQAVSEAAVPAVAALLRVIERDSNAPWLVAEGLAVLDGIARPLGSWERSFDRSRRKSSYEEGVRWEHAIAERLGLARGQIVALLTAADPEVRALAGQLLADVPMQPGSDLHQLKTRFSVESEPLVRACIAEAVVRAAVRSEDPVLISDAVEWAQTRLSDAEAVVRFRTARALMSTEATAVEVARDVLETDAAAQQIVWPSEV